MHGHRNRGLASLALVAIAVFAAGPAAASGAGDEADAPLLVFAASSLQGPLDTVADAWTAATGVRVVVSYAATPALARQIDHGAPAQVVVAADAMWMDWLVERGRIQPRTRVDLLGNALVLVRPRGATADAAAARRGVAPIDAAGSPAHWLPAGLGASGRLAVADVDTVPAGRYAKQALLAIGRWNVVAERLAMADSVRGALAYVARAEAPLGIVYATDARAEPDVEVVASFPDDTHAPIVYPAAVIADARPDALRFVAFLRGSPDAARTFRAAGFRYLPRAVHDATPAARAPDPD